jgi:hypothetical protein
MTLSDPSTRLTEGCKVQAVDFSNIRRLLLGLPTDHDADGEHRPTVGDVFAPEQHASALATSTLIVVGARGAGKSFWAGVLGQPDTRQLAAEVYPRLGLDRVTVAFGYNGFDTGSAVTRRTVEARTRDGGHDAALIFWQAVLLRSALATIDDSESEESIATFIDKYKDPEDFEARLRQVDRALDAADKTCLVLFDALDTLSRNWTELTKLTDALFEACWALRARRRIRAKVFIRPDQLNDEGLKFVELPKLRSGRVELDWSRNDLYGLLFTRLAEAEQEAGGNDFQALCREIGYPVPSTNAERIRQWELAWSEDAQKRVLDRMAGRYMGKSATKGATYPWTYKHLADGRDVVTPRSFLKLFVEAARHTSALVNQVITAEGIRQGLREASKTRVEQLALEYPWIKRALAPLAGLKVPCPSWEIHDAWQISNTVGVISAAAEAEGFLPPYQNTSGREPEEDLEAAMARIGVLSYRTDGRADMPDLFRIAARMLKLGGVALKSKS